MAEKGTKQKSKTGKNIERGSGQTNVVPVTSFKREESYVRCGLGRAIIFNHVSFANSALKKREGTLEDEKSLRAALKKLKFEVTVYRNLTLAKIIKIVTALTDFTEYDCLLISILTHGGENNVLYADDKAYKLETISDYFTAAKCPTLAGKPKLFFIQACQGNELPDPVAVGVTPLGSSKSIFESISNWWYPQSSKLQNFHTYIMPSHADFLYAFATTPGYVAYKKEGHGSLFIQSLCQELRKIEPGRDILTLLTFVIQGVALQFKKNEKPVQLPCIVSTLTRLLYLKEDEEDTRKINSAEGLLVRWPQVGRRHKSSKK